jgi:hypothetical protein
MVTTLQLRFCTAPVRPAVAWFFPGSDAGAWLEELSGCGLAQADTRLFVVPRSLADRAPVGLLAIPAAEVSPTRTPAGLACGVLGGGIYLPVDARLSAAAAEDELGALCRMPVLFLHPAIGLSGFETERECHVWDFLVPPGERPMDWNHARSGPPLPARLNAISLLQKLRPSDVFGAAAQEIGSEADEPLPPAPGEPEEDAASRAGRWMRKFLAERILNRSPRHPSSGVGSQPPSRLRQWAGRQLERVLGDLERVRNKELHRLLHLLDHDPEEGLRHAIPISDLPHRGRGTPGTRLVPHGVDFSADHLGGEAVDLWHVPQEIREKLHRLYRSLAGRELRLGHHRRAAYIFAKLLGDLAAAANALSQGRHYREAALLYLEQLGNPLQAARCLADGGLLREAIEIYEEHHLFLEAADLYERLGETAQARAALHKVVGQRLAAGDFLKAAALLEERLGEPDQALAVLERGWPASAQAVSCLRAQLGLLGRLGRHEAALQRVAQLDQVPGPVSLALPVTQVLSEHATSYPDQRLRQACADLALRLTSARLSADALPSSDAASFVALLVRLAPEDRLLARDGQRHLAGRSQPVLRSQWHPPSLNPSNWRKPRLVHSFELMPSVDWLSVCRAGPFYVAAGISNRGLTVVRGTFTGHLQSVDWDVLEVEGPRGLLLAADPSSQDYVAVALAGKSPLVERVLHPTDPFSFSSCRVGTPGWLPQTALRLAIGGRSAWSVQVVSGRHVVNCYSLAGNLLWTEDVTQSLFSVADFDPAAEACLAAHPAGAMVALDKRLVLARPDRLVLSWDLPRLAIGLAPTPAGELGGALVLLEWGAVMHWMGSDDIIPLDDDLHTPRGTFLPGRHLVLVSGGVGKLLAVDGGHVTSARQFGVSDAPVLGVLPAEGPGEFAVFFENGKVDCFKAAD